MSYIWTWVQAEDQGMVGNLETGAAPRLVPVSDGGGGYVSAFNQKTTAQIDVVTDFPWTQSPTEGARTEVPWIMMTEKLITANPMLNQIANNLAVAGNFVSDDSKDTIVAQMSKQLGGEEGGIANSDVMQVYEKAKESFGKATEAGGNANSMFPYTNLYTTKDTGFVYRFPYFNNKNYDVGNQFGGQQAEDGVSGVASGLMDLGSKIGKGAAGIAKAPNFMEPGSYIEQSKFFAFSGREKAYTFSFPLDNTDKHEDIVRNWQLIYLLTYQNLPNRMSRDLIMPPCIYEAHIPGMWYSKYAYISNMTVNFVGTRRVMNLEIPSYTHGNQNEKVINPKTIQAIIPDAYEVSITVQELVGNAQNMAYTLIEGMITTQ